MRDNVVMFRHDQRPRPDAAAILPADIDTREAVVERFPLPKLRWLEMSLGSMAWGLYAEPRHGKRRCAGWIYPDTDETGNKLGFRACVPTLHNPCDVFEDIDLGLFPTLRQAQAAVRANVPPEQLWLS